MLKGIPKITLRLSKLDEISGAIEIYRSCVIYCVDVHSDGVFDRVTADDKRDWNK